MTGILYLSGEAVSVLLPPIPDQLALVARTFETMRNGGFQLPPKPAIHPRDDAFIHAMPAYLAESDVAVLKWIGGSSGNKARGLPYLSGLIVVNDPATAAPTAIIDAAEITAARTAAVTALCVRRFAVPGWRTVAIVGFGVQGHAHAATLASINDRLEVVVAGGRGTSETDLRDAVREADVVITSIPFDRPATPRIRADWIDSQLLVPVDFDASVEAAAVRQADLFMVDHVDTYAHYRSLGYFDGWPEPQASLAEALTLEPGPGRVVCCNLGIATLDAAFADVVVKAAHARGVGTVLH